MALAFDVVRLVIMVLFLIVEDTLGEDIGDLSVVDCGKVLVISGIVDIWGEDFAVTGAMVKLAERALIVSVVLSNRKEVPLEFLFLVVILVAMVRLGVDDTLSGETSDADTFKEVFTRVPANRFWCGVVDKTNVVEFIARVFFVTILRVGDLLEAAVEFRITVVV